MLVIEIASGIVLAVFVLFVVAAALVAPNGASGATEADYRQLIADYRSGRSNFGPCSYWQNITAWDEAFPEEAAKRNARPRPFNPDYSAALRAFYARYPEEEQRDRVNDDAWNPNWR